MSLLLLLLTSTGSLMPLPDKLSGSEVVRRMEKMYAHLRSYSDTGVLTDGARRITFITAYQSPGKMFFQFTSEGETYYFCAAGKKGAPTVNLYSPRSEPKSVWQADAYVNGRMERDDLEMEIAGFTGISMGTAYHVPTMLYPKMAGRAFHDLKRPLVVRMERIDGEDCFVVRAERSTLWIGAKTYALHKLDDPTGDEPEITVYKPVLNPKIPANRFIFKPPAKLKQ